MQDFIPKANPKAVKSARDFRKGLIEQFLTIGDMGKNNGRPRHSVLGPLRRQIDLLNAVEILRLYEAKLADEGYSIDAELQGHLLNDKMRRLFVGALLSQVSGFTARYTPGAPLKSLRDSCGKMIRLMADGPFKHGGPGRYRYIAAGPASPMESLAAFNTWIALNERRAHKATEIIEIFKPALDVWPEGAATLDAAVLAENEARLAQKR